MSACLLRCDHITAFIIAEDSRCDWFTGYAIVASRRAVVKPPLTVDRQQMFLIGVGTGRRSSSSPLRTLPAHSPRRGRLRTVSRETCARAAWHWPVRCRDARGTQRTAGSCSRTVAGLECIGVPDDARTLQSPIVTPRPSFTHAEEKRRGGCEGRKQSTPTPVSRSWIW